MIPINPDIEILPGQRSHHQGTYLRTVERSFTILDKKTNATSPQMREFLSLKKDASAVLVFCPSEDKYLLLRQYRVVIHEKTGDYDRAWIYEIVAGVIDREKGENPETTAIKEANEEAGVVVYPSAMKKIASVFVAPGVSTEMVHIYHAIVPTVAQNGNSGLASEGELIASAWLTGDQIRQLHKDGKIEDAKTLIALMKAGVL